MNDRRILVTGAGIAGPAAASWLAAGGWDVTVVERWEHLRDDGQNVDVRSTGREVVRRMGLLDAVREHHTHETATSFVDADGRVYASFPSDDTDVHSATADLEVLRGQLARILHEHAAARAEFVFGDHVVALDDDGDGVDVTFAQGPTRRFDVVVVAEGSRSTTRELVVPRTVTEPLGLLWTYFTIPRTEDDDRAWRLHLGGRGRTVHLRPDNVGTTRAMLSLRTNARGLGRLGRQDVVDVLRATFGDLGWETPRILAALDEAEPYVDEVARVRLPRWHRGRVVLLGDAAWNAGPFGTGTTSALTGAYVLAGELTAAPDDFAGAFSRYERLLRPMTDRAQEEAPYIMHPRSTSERRGVQGLLRVMASRPGMAAARAVGVDLEPPLREIELPGYPLDAPDHAGGRDRAVAGGRRGAQEAAS